MQELFARKLSRYIDLSAPPEHRIRCSIIFVWDGSHGHPAHLRPTPDPMIGAPRYDGDDEISLIQQAPTPTNNHFAVRAMAATHLLLQTPRKRPVVRQPHAPADGHEPSPPPAPSSSQSRSAIARPSPSSVGSRSGGQRPTAPSSPSIEPASAVTSRRRPPPPPLLATIRCPRSHGNPPMTVRPFQREQPPPASNGHDRPISSASPTPPHTKPATRLDLAMTRARDLIPSNHHVVHASRRPLPATVDQRPSSSHAPWPTHNSTLDCTLQSPPSGINNNSPP
ncbi:hypothetical protein ACLOJK_007758 [Asimina triloba]